MGGASRSPPHAVPRLSASAGAMLPHGTCTVARHTSRGVDTHHHPVSGVRDSGEAPPKHSSKVSALYRVHIPGGTLPGACAHPLTNFVPFPMIGCRGS